MPGPRDKLGLLYYGGKLAISDWVILNIPKHSLWVEICGGGGSVSFNKGKSDVEIYNDIGYVSEFMEILRDREMGAELYRLLGLMPYGRDQYYRSASYVQQKVRNFYAIMDQYNVPDKEQWIYFHEWCHNMPDRIIHAAHWYVTIFQGFTHEEMGDSWLVAKSLSQSRTFQNHVESLPYITQRMKDMQIEHLSFERLIPMYDTPGTCFYADPPYMAESRAVNGNYINEMTIEQHIHLLQMLNDCKGNAMISGYGSELYDAMLKNWRCIERTHQLTIRNTASMKAGKLGERTEKLWIKRSDQTLFEAGTHSNVASLSAESIYRQEPVLP